MKHNSTRKRTISRKNFLGLLFLLAAAFFGLALKGYTYLGLAFLVLSVLCFAFELLDIYAKRKPDSKGPLRCKRALQLCTLLGICFFLFFEIPVIAGASGTRNDDEPVDYIIVLGAGLRGETPSVTLQNRLNTAADYLKANPETIAIVSGGQGPDEAISEAQAMKTWLVRLGIPADRIVMEDKSTSTYENLTYSLAIIHSLHTGSPSFAEPSLAILSSEYHMHRASLMAEELGLGTPQMVPAKTTLPFLKLAYFIREAAGMARYQILGY